jgi:cytochrome c2
MTYFQVKTLLAVPFVAALLTAAFSMLALMGRENPAGAKRLRMTHRVSGYTVAALVAVLASMGFSHLAAVGDALSLRGVLHWTYGSLLIFLVLLKIGVTRPYRRFLKLAPGLGMTITVLGLLVVTLSAVYFILAGAPRGDLIEEFGVRPGSVSASLATEAPRVGIPGDAAAGAVVFETNCAGCHAADSEEPVVGPGLKGLFDRERLPVSGRLVTRESVHDQIVSPVGTMPSFEGILSDREVDDVIAYLETL